MTILVRIRMASFTIQLQKCQSDYSNTLLKEFVLIMNLFRHVNSYLISVHQRYNKTKSETLPCSE